jgi:hypothetical protein
MNLEEYRFLDGWSVDKKKGSTRSDRIPTELIDELDISGSADYQLLIPEALDYEFTARDYKKASGQSLQVSRTALHVLNYIGAIERTGKKGNTLIYRRTLPLQTVNE